MERLRKEKIQRHIANLLIFTGFWKCKYWIKGERQFNKKLPKKKTIFKWRKP